MDSGSLFTLVAVVLAVVTLVPTRQRLFVLYRFSWIDWIIFAILPSLLILYIFLYDFFKKIGLGVELSLASLGLSRDQVVFFLFIISIIYFFSRWRFSSVIKRKIDHYRDWVLELLYQSEYLLLLKLLKRDTNKIIKISSSQYFRHVIGRKIQPPLIDSFFAADNMFADYESFKYGLGKYASKLLLKNKHSIDAGHILSSVYGSEVFIRYVAQADPYFLLTLLNTEFSQREELLNLYIQALLDDKSSVLFNELKNNQNISGLRYDILPSNKFLYCFLGDAKKAENLGVWKPFGDYLLDSLKDKRKIEIFNEILEPESDILEKRWVYSEFIVLRFFDLMLKEALFQNIQWHMWLYYFPPVFERIIENIDSDKSIYTPTEWPTTYHYFLYEIINILCELIRAVSQVPSSQENLVTNEIDLEHENGNIPKSAIIALSQILYFFVITDKLSIQFKKYLLKIILGVINDLEKIESDTSLGLIGVLAMAIRNGRSYSTGSGEKQMYQDELRKIWSKDYEDEYGLKVE